MEMIFCETYHCSLAVAACASRHINAVTGGPQRVGNYRAGTNDTNCKACANGAARAKTLGKKGVMEYRSMLAGIRKDAAGTTDAAYAPEIETLQLEETYMNERITEPGGKTKTCKGCGEDKYLVEGFYKNKASKDGYDGLCKACRKKLIGKRLDEKAAGAGRRRDTHSHRPDDTGGIAGPGDFNRLATLLSGVTRFDYDQLVEIRGLCERIGGSIGTYLDLHAMFGGL